MARPRKPSTATVRRLYSRLLEGPFWVGDWKSTKIGSYGTTNKAVQHLYRAGLLTRRRAGHKVLYELNKQKGVLAWWPLLTTKQERRKLVKVGEETKDWAKRFVDRIKPRIKIVGRYGTFSQEKLNEVGIELTNEEIFQSLDEIDPDLDPEQALHYWYKTITHQLCPECLSKRKKIVNTISDPELGEIICPECGFIITRDQVQWEIISRPSPFPPPQH